MDKVKFGFSSGRRDGCWGLMERTKPCFKLDNEENHHIYY